LNRRSALNRRLALALGGIAVALVVTGTTVAVRPWFSQSSEPMTAADIGGPFALVAGDGRTRTDADFRGKWMLVYFGYTQCPDACPTALTSIAAALDMLKARRDTVAPIFITVDPARDTPAVMGHYVALFDKQITGLTGTQAQIDRVTREYRVYAARHPTKGGGYTMDHSSIIYLMDPQGRFNSVLDGAANPEDIAAKITKLES